MQLVYGKVRSKFHGFISALPAKTWKDAVW